MLSKNTAPNLIALLVIIASQAFADPWRSILLSTGLFALSGALTNWLAIHMLFERVPGLYGSGVIVVHFDEFRQGIRRLVREQLFSPERVERILGDAGSQIDLAPLVAKIDLDAAFDQLIATVMESNFGGMLAMVGGEAALQPMREPFKKRMSRYLEDVARSPRFQEAVQSQVAALGSSEHFVEKIDRVLAARLEELTPGMVRDMVQDMIRRHLGWLVIWGGVIGGLIGLLTGVLRAFAG